MAKGGVGAKGRPGGDEDMAGSDDEEGDMSSLKAEMEAHAQRTGKAEISHDDVMGLFPVVSRARQRVKTQGKSKSSRGTPQGGTRGEERNSIAQWVTAAAPLVQGASGGS